MTPKRSMHALCLFLALILPAAASAAETLYGTVVSVTATGMRSVTADQVLAVVRTKPGDALLRAVVNEDVKAIWQMGLFQDVQALVERQGGADDPKMALTFAVTERPVVQELRLFGNKELSDGDLVEKAAIKEDEVYDPGKVTAAVDKILALYHEKDYNSASVKTDVRPGSQPGKVVINMTIQEGLKMKVASIKVTGNMVFPESKIKGEMEDVKEVGWFGIGGSYDKVKLGADLKRVLMAYYREGYIKAKLEGYTLDQIDAHAAEVAGRITTFNEADKRIEIAFKVDEGVQYKLGKLEMEGNTMHPTSELAEMMDTRPGEVFDRERWERDIQKVRGAYQEKGYIYANPNPQFTYDDAAGRVDVKLSWVEGNIAYVESIKIRGNDTTKDKVIRRELTIKEGEPFDTAKVLKSRERVLNLGFFENVVPDYEPGSDMDKLTLVFDVGPERKTGTLSLGAGYSSAEGLVGYLQVSQNNLFGNGQAVSAMWEFGQYKTSYSLSFTEPWLFDTPTSAGIDIFKTSKYSGYNNQGYQLDSTGGALRFGHTLSPSWKVYDTYRYSSDEYSQISDSMKPYVTEGIINVSSMTPALVFDTRDNVFDATRGFYNTWSVQLAGGYLGGDRSFYKPVWDSSMFFSTPAIFGIKYLNKFILGLHGKTGLCKAFSSGAKEDDVPAADRFYMGGTDTVRGYNDQSINVSGGGHFMLQTNIEYGFKPFDALKLRAFYDSGNAWASPDEGDVHWSDPYLAPSVGFGFLFTIPTSVIQIRLDWGYPLDPTAPTRAGGRVHFNIGNIF